MIYMNQQFKFKLMETIIITKTTAAQNEDALNYHRVRELYFLAVVFTAIIDIPLTNQKTVNRSNRGR